MSMAGDVKESRWVVGTSLGLVTVRPCHSRQVNLFPSFVRLSQLCPSLPIRLNQPTYFNIISSPNKLTEKKGFHEAVDGAHALVRDT
jgi:hypothetical protein